MDAKDIFWLSYKDLSEKKVRTALTVLMVMIGVASIIALVSQTAGISAAIQKEMNSLGPTSIMLTSTKSTGFSVSDVADLYTLPNVSSATPILTGTATLVSNNVNTSVSVLGVTTNGLSELLNGNVSMYQGSVFEDTVAPTAVVGYSAAIPSSTQNVQVGLPATLRSSSGRGSTSSTISVSGILKSYGSTLVSVDSAVVLSLPAAQVLLHKTSFNTILVKASNSSSVSSLTTLLTDVYSNNARVMSMQSLAETAASMINSITLLLVVIAGISLLVAAVGIMNIMLMSVLERTHDIGIMKALGFKNRQVMIIFLSQALIIGLLGGIIGIGVGAGASYGLAYGINHLSSGSSSSTSGSAAASSSQAASSGGAPSGISGGSPPQPGAGESSASSGGSQATYRSSGSSSSSSSSLSYSPVLSPVTIAEALFVAVLVSALAGIYPAWRASKMEPIDALRSL
ncbi:MacB-like periplasmic core domain protein [uncultured archaeon]|nr:MacB-like periplasmic core domain protein [uncultured archaeon]